MRNIELVFENLEYIIIPKERINKINIEPIEETYILDSKQTHLKTKGLEIEIKFNDKSELIYTYDRDEAPLGMSENNVSKRPSVLGRIFNYKDITHITLLDDDFKELQYVSVPWEEIIEDENELMDVKIEDNLIKLTIKERSV